MITPEQKKTLEDLGKSQYGFVLKLFLEEKLKDIGDITTLKSWEEAQGRKHATLLIKELFSFMEEKNIVEKSKNQYE